MTTAYPHNIRLSEKLIHMMSALATGWMPWGIQMSEAAFPLCEGSPDDEDGGMPLYIMCCYYTLSVEEAEPLLQAGIVDNGPQDEFGRPSIVITQRGREWLKDVWDWFACNEPTSAAADRWEPRDSYSQTPAAAGTTLRW